MSESILNVLKELYTSDIKLFICSEEIDKLEDTFKKRKDLNLFSYEEIVKYIEEKFGIHIKKSQNIVNEINKQIKCNKALQPEVIFEGNVAKTFAKFYELNDFFDYDDLKSDGIDDKYKVREVCPNMPQAFYNYFDEHIRYMYYDKERKDIFIAQYGDPNKIDLELFYHNSVIKIEIKDMPAKSGEVDVKYNDDGKLIIDERLKNTEYEAVVDNFNLNDSIFDNLGRNIQVKDAVTKTKILSSYIEKKHIDILATEKDDMLILIAKDDLFFLSTSRSEIRTTGRNWGSIFVSKNKLLLFIKSIAEAEIRGDEIRIPCTLMTEQKKRGHNGEISSRKINQVFKIDKSKVNIKNEYAVFNLQDVQQVRATISVHLSIDKCCDYNTFKHYYLCSTESSINNKAVDYFDGEGKCGFILYYEVNDAKVAISNNSTKWKCKIIKSENWVDDLLKIINNKYFVNPIEIKILQKSENILLIDNIIESISSVIGQKDVLSNSIEIDPNLVVDIIKIAINRK